jgi:anti-sigma B factor antagonist
MRTTIRNVKGVTVLDLQGKLNIGEGDVALREAFVERLDLGNRKFLINLDQVKAVDSSGLGELIRCKATAAARGAEVKLLRVNLKARKLLTMSSLVGVFEMFDDEDLAVASFD